MKGKKLDKDLGRLDKLRLLKVSDLPPLESKVE